MSGLTESVGIWNIDLGGQAAGIIQSLEGGQVKADKAETKMGGDFITRKTIVGITWDAVTLKLGISQSKPIHEWIKATLNADYAFKDGVITAATMKFEARRAFTWTGGLLTEIQAPACDANSKNVSFLTLKFQPTHGEWKPASGKIQGGSQGALKIKNWTEQSYKIQIDGLDLSRASKVGAITMKQEVERDTVGELREYQYVPTRLDFGDLEITVAEVTAQAIYDWHEDFVYKGNCGNDKEKGGSLTYLAQNMKDELGSVTFEHLGIYELTTSKAESQGKELKRVTAKLYCEKYDFNLTATD
jgi:hypothetical protein